MNKILKYRKFPSFVLRMKMSKDGRTDGNDKLMLCMLFNLEETGKSYSQKELSMMLGMSEATVSHSIKRLESMGFVLTTKGKFDPSTKTKTQNTYSLNWSKLEEHITDNDYFISNETVEEPKTVTPPAEEKKTVVTPKIELDPIVDGEIDEDDCRYGEIDATNPMVSFLKEEDDTPSFKDRIKENQFNCDVKEAATEMVSLVRLKTPKAKLDEVFDRHINNISMKYSQRLDYVGDRIRAKAREILKAA